MTPPSSTSDDTTSGLLAQLTTDEKIALLSGAGYWRTVGYPERGIAAFTLNDGPHGVRAVSADDHLGASNAATAVCFPTASALSCSWDTSLARAHGSALAAAARLADVDVVLGPAMNIKRTPLGGRNFEYFSEDPCLTGRLAAAVVSGVESGGVGASLKHFAVNNQEYDRFTISAEVDERALREIYLRGFEIAVTEGRPATVMSAYNAVNGVPCSENHRLLTGILREEWGFDGLVVSDWGAVQDRVTALRAGLDLEMPASQGLGAAAIGAALKSGELSEEDVDRAAARVVELAARFAREDRPEPVTTSEAELADIARTIAQQSIVLLRNERGTLPLKRTTAVALIGEFAENPRFQGGGSSNVQVASFTTARKEISRFLPSDQVLHARGCEGEEIDEALLDEAVEVAAQADVALLFVGLTEMTESEGFDRETLSLPASHLALIDRVSAVTPRTVVVLHKGSAVDIASWHDKADAILDLNLGGQEVAAAALDVIFGDVNPSGRTSETVPLRLEDTPAHLDYPGGLRRAHYRESIWVGYRYYDRRKMPVAYPFGHGLSYTDFAYADPRAVVHDDESVTVEVAVRNVGERDGFEVVQVYVHDDVSSVARPERELRGFSKIWIAAGESVTARIELDRRDFAFWDEHRDRWTIESGAFTIEIGSSSRDIRARVGVDLAGDAPTAEIIDRHTPVRYFLGDPEFAAVIEQFVSSYPMFGGDFDSLPPLARRIVTETINGMPLEKLRLVSGGAFSEDAIASAIARLTSLR
ncbi:glycoside hydrolase family 3 C-terminal domain-containing protein [Streptomyces echinatus]|uniref:Exo-alpha-(1->6)-L-arabinopyranosidase n=1 Tax=Streptomyces echinatus TaxID=67293 RepID=A0A7W9PPP9_9ACTN|nr:glycoside hydrolase family 3 C-terminal domain-containing protein [Streptomyces echinatus]MBB5925643.1 beta-glucosidase [Streptomyces echinatus]